MLKNDSAFSAETEKAVQQIHQLMEMDVANKLYSLYLMISICELKHIARSGDLERYDEVYGQVSAVYSSLEDKSKQALAFEYAQFIQNYAVHLFLFNDSSAKSRAYDAARYAIELFLALPGIEMAKAMVSVLYSHLANQYFQDKNKEQAIDAAEKTVAFSRDRALGNKALADEGLAKALFNCANICFQFDSYDKAEQYFFETIQMCLSGGELRYIEIFRYACDYYAQLLVILERYDEAVGHYALFINTILKQQIGTDRAYEYCAQFGYRIGLIALNYMDNQELAIMGLENALAFIDSMENLNNEMLKLRAKIMSMFEE